MIIAEKDYKLKLISPVSNKFDLYLPCVVKKKEGGVTKEFKPVAVGVTIDSAIKKIIHYRLSLRNKQDAITMKAYLEFYKKCIQELREMFCVYEKELINN